MENKNTNTLLIMIIVFLAVALGVCGGVLFTKLNENTPVQTEENKSNNEQKDDNNSKTNDDTNSVEKITSKEVNNLMNKYISSSTKTFCGNAYIIDLNDDALKSSLALKNVTTGRPLSCASIYNKAGDNGAELNVYSGTSCFDSGSEYSFAHIYLYDDVLDKKRELFGDNSVLARKTFEVSTEYFDYISEQGAFVPHLKNGGCAGNTENTIVSFEQNDDSLIVIANIKKLNENENENAFASYNYKYTFKNENNHYYLTNIIKLN